MGMKREREKEDGSVKEKERDYQQNEGNTEKNGPLFINNNF